MCRISFKETLFNKSISNLKGLNRSDVLKCVSFYKAYGEYGLLARSSFYYHQKQNKLPDKYKVIKELIKLIYHKHKGLYRYRRIIDELQNQVIIINHKTVLRLMKVLGLKSIIRVKKHKSYKGEQSKIVANVLKRNFKATTQNQKWATNVTEFNVAGNKLYLSPIIDFNQEIISYELT